jgi:hypothetical protein
MPKYRIEANYLSEGINGLLKEGVLGGVPLLMNYSNRWAALLKLFILPSVTRTFSSLAISRTMPPPQHSPSG